MLEDIIETPKERNNIQMESRKEFWKPLPVINFEDGLALQAPNQDSKVATSSRWQSWHQNDKLCQLPKRQPLTKCIGATKVPNELFWFCDIHRSTHGFQKLQQLMKE